MYISTKGRYALRLMLDIAENTADGENVPLKQAAQRQGISLKYLEQIITVLARGGMVRSVRGSQGGYRLTRRPEEYTVGMILRLTEGTLAPVSCLEGDENTCKRKNICPTLFVWEKLDKAVNDTLDGITLRDIMDNDERLNSNGDDYVI